MSLFKWRKGEHESWLKKINRYNNKIDKAKKEGYDGNLPNKINYNIELVSMLKDKMFSRREFNNQMKTIDIFLEKNSLDLVKSKRGAIAPKWDLDTIKKVVLPDINRVNREFKKQNEEKSGFKEKKDLNPNETRNRKLNFENKSKNDWEMFVKTFADYNRTTEEKQKKATEGYYKAIENELGKGTVESLALQGILNELPPEIISANALLNPNTEFRFVYSKDEAEIRFRKLKNSWSKILKDYNKEQKKKEKDKKRKR